MGNSSSKEKDDWKKGGSATEGWDASAMEQRGASSMEQVAVEDALQRETAAAEGMADAWQGDMDRAEFLEIAGLRRMLLSGVAVTRHVLGVTHPISLFTTKQFDSIFWYHRHTAGVHQFMFDHLIDVRPAVDPNTGERTMVSKELGATLEDMAQNPTYGADIASKTFVLIFSIPKTQVNERHTNMLGRPTSFVNLMQDPSQVHNMSAARRMSLDQPVPMQLYADDAMLSDSSNRVQVSVDVICDNIHTYDMLFDGFVIISQHYEYIRNSPEYKRMVQTQTVGHLTPALAAGVHERPAAGGLRRSATAQGGLGRTMPSMANFGTRDERGVETGATQVLNTFHQLYQPEFHPNHRQGFRIKTGTEVEVMFVHKVLQASYKKKGMEMVSIDFTKNPYFKPGTFCLGTVVKRYKDNTYDIRYVNGPYQTDEDPDNSRRPLFPRKGLVFRRVPKALLVVDYDAQLATSFPWGIFLITLVEVGYFVYYVSTHSENKQGTVSWTTGVAGHSSLYLQTVGDWPGCQDLLWGKGQYWRLASYQMVHFGVNHIGFNAFAQLLFGIPIERVHGTFRLVLIYELGVVGAALFTGWSDPMKIVVGASGGVYTILGAHWANLALNWTAMSNGTVPPFFRMLVLASLMGVDLVQYFLYRSDGTSYAVHLGGWLIGFAGGVLLLRNLEMEWLEYYILRPFFLVVFLALIGFSLYWDPRTWPPEQPGFVEAINFGDNEPQCCWKVIDCEDHFDDQGITWTETQWDNLYCDGFDLTSAFDDDVLTSCSSMLAASQLVDDN